MSEQIWYQQLPKQFVVYIVRPFKITKVLELLYALNWIWVALISLFMEKIPLSRSTPGTALYYPYSVIFWFLISAFSFYGIWHNVVIMRKIALIFNILITTFLLTQNLFNSSITAASGYLFILTGLTIFAYWRMDLAD